MATFRQKSRLGVQHRVGRTRCERGNLPGSQGAGEDANLVDVADKTACYLSDDGLSGRPHRCDGVGRVSGDEEAVNIEFCQAGPEDAGRVMPFSVVVGERGFGVRHDVRANGLIEYDGKMTISRHPQLPRTTAATLDPTEIGRAHG